MALLDVGVCKVNWRRFDDAYRLYLQGYIIMACEI